MNRFDCIHKRMFHKCYCEQFVIPEAVEDKLSQDSFEMAKQTQSWVQKYQREKNGSQSLSKVSFSIQVIKIYINF